ncbi:hypothetical protein QUB56_31430, partial [Microcoleus sp. AR_TQ3_B6]|uniref:hypothetical protein n=1 Tax=Microcoleus sp. AR_TQ3_B6 TaxID=3055284 RepID=UPI002FD38BC8
SFLDGRDAHPTIIIKIVSYLIRDPKGDAREDSSPLLRGVRGDLDSDTNKRDGQFDVKLTPMGSAVFHIYQK